MKYSAIVRRITMERTTVIVEADDEDDAWSKAEEAAEYVLASKWELVDEDFKIMEVEEAEDTE